MSTKPQLFDQLIEQARTLGALPMAVAHPCSKDALQGAIDVYTQGIATPILIGPEARIRQLADSMNLSLDGVEIDSVPHSHAAAARAVERVREGSAAFLMKGSLHTDEFLTAIIDRTKGIRTERRLSHIFLMNLKSYHKTLFITDSAINIAPDLTTKMHICQNAIDLCHVLGITQPKVAILSAVETINEKIQSTLDAAALCKMADRGQIVGGLLDGPLAFDNAISRDAAQIKGILSPVAGDPDILLTPDLESSNILSKQLIYLAGAASAGVVMGAKVPVVLNSRSDDARSRLVSAAVAALIAEHKRKLIV